MSVRVMIGPANMASSVLPAIAGRFGIRVPYRIMTTSIWITPSLMKASRIGRYPGPRWIRSRPTVYWEVIIRAVTPRNSTYSVTRSCL